MHEWRGNGREVVMGQTSIDLRFRCGHRASLGRDTDMASVQCPQCGERRISYVTAPSPVFRGTATGPHVTTDALDPITITLGE